MADDYLDSAFSKGNEAISRFLSRNPLYWFAKGDTLKSFSALDSMENKNDAIVFTHFLKEAPSNLEFISLFHPTITDKPRSRKIYSSWRSRFEGRRSLDTCAINNFLSDLNPPQRARTYLYYILARVEGLELGPIDSVKINTKEDFIYLLAAKALYFRGLSDFDRSETCANEARILLNWFGDKRGGDFVDSIVSDQKKYYIEKVKPNKFRFFSSTDCEKEVVEYIRKRNFPNSPIFKNGDLNILYNVLSKFIIKTNKIPSYY